VKDTGASQLTYALRRRIRDVVRALPSAQVEPIAAALRAGLGSSGDLNIASLFVAIHPHLETVAPSRPREGDYALALPFADMLVERGAGPKRPGRVDRLSVTRLVGVLAGDRSTAALTIAVDGFRALYQGVDFDTEGAALAAIWAAADAALGNIADAAEPTAAHIDAMGNAAAAADLIEMARVLRLGHEIHCLRQALPPAPIAELSGSDTMLVREACDRVRAIGGPQAVVDLLHALMGRLRQPEDILKVVRLLHARDRYGENWSRKLNCVVERVVETLEAVVAPLGATPAEEADERPVIAAVVAAARILRGYAATIGLPKGGEFHARIGRVRMALAAAVEAVILQSALSVVSGSFLKGWDTGRTIFPAAFDDRLRSGAVQRAELRAVALTEILPFAEDLAIGERMRGLHADLQSTIEAYGERLIGGMDAGGGVVWMPAVMSLVHIMELLFGAEPADRFRRRAAERLKG